MLKHPLMLALVAIFLFSMTLSANAQDNVGWGLSATLGSSQIRDKDGADSFSGSALGMAADIEYRFTPNFALGFGGFSLGRADDTFKGENTEIEVRGYELFGRFIYPMSTTADLYARIGAANYFVDIDPGFVSIDDALFGEDALELGFGVDFNRQNQLAIRLEARYLNGGQDETGMLLMAGVNYLF